MAAGIRFSVAGAILFAWAWAGGFSPKREHWMAGAVVGALFFLVSHGILYWAEQTVASGPAALLILRRLVVFSAEDVYSIVIVVLPKWRN